MKIVNPFKSHKKKDFVAYWDLKQFSQLLNKGIEVGSNYFFLIKRDLQNFLATYLIQIKALKDSCKNFTNIFLW